MISRIRVEARADSMEQAQREIEIVLEHVCQVGVLEGIVPHSSRVTDNHFSEVFQPDKWTQIGQPAGQMATIGIPDRARMRYEGRRHITFDPEITEGGLRLYGFEVTSVDDWRPHGIAGEENSTTEPVREDVTDKVMVLYRKNPVTREHTWERSSSFGTLGQDHEVGDLSTFNRARHDTRDGLLREVWLRGIVDMGKDLPTNVYGTVRRDQHDDQWLFEYTQDIKPGQTVDEIVDVVEEKINLWADGHTRQH